MLWLIEGDPTERAARWSLRLVLEHQGRTIMLPARQSYEIARNLSGTSLVRQAWFVAFDGEEDGLHGSRAFVSGTKPQFLSG